MINSNYFAEVIFNYLGGYGNCCRTFSFKIFDASFNEREGKTSGLNAITYRKPTYRKNYLLLPI